jgi:hypothetical protein
MEEASERAGEMAEQPVKEGVGHENLTGGRRQYTVGCGGRALVFPTGPT